MGQIMSWYRIRYKKIDDKDLKYDSEFTFSELDPLNPVNDDLIDEVILIPMFNSEKD
jgi:hypothetical protein